MKQVKHWQDPVNAVVAVGLVLSPWVIGFTDHRVAMANALVVGVALLATALGAVWMPRAWEEWTEAALGIWLIASPWLLGFRQLAGARSAAVIAGFVVAALAIWVLATDRDYRPGMHHPKAG